MNNLFTNLQELLPAILLCFWIWFLGHFQSTTSQFFHSHRSILHEHFFHVSFGCFVFWSTLAVLTCLFYDIHSLFFPTYSRLSSSFVLLTLPKFHPRFFFDCTCISYLRTFPSSSTNFGLVKVRFDCNLTYDAAHQVEVEHYVVNVYCLLFVYYQEKNSCNYTQSLIVADWFYYSSLTKWKVLWLLLYS
jgi:hypothetical protein